MKVIDLEKVYTIKLSERELEIIIDCMNSTDPLNKEEEEILEQLINIR